MGIPLWRAAPHIRSVDILVDLRPPVGWEIVHLQMRLEELLGLKVDLVTHNAVMRKPLLWRSIEEDLVYA